MIMIVGCDDGVVVVILYTCNDVVFAVVIVVVVNVVCLLLKIMIMILWLWLWLLLLVLLNYAVVVSLVVMDIGHAVVNYDDDDAC